MQNKNIQQEEHLQKTDKIEIPLIGIRKYEFLKSLKFEDLSEIQKTQIQVFENKQRFATPEQVLKRTKYLQEILEPKKKNEVKFTAKQLWELYKQNFELVNNRKFIKIENVTIKNLEPIIYYFSKDERFFQCDNLSKLSEPSFEKGLLIIGNYGNGKTSTMKVFESIFKSIPYLSFKGYSANEVVLMFEKCTGDNADILRNEFEKTMYFGNRYFDDLKTERIASNFGKVNIFKEILEERYRKFERNNKNKTYMTCNFKEGFEGDIEKGVDEFGEKYGSRVWDRIFSMFNIVEFKGKSFRK